MMVFDDDVREVENLIRKKFGNKESIKINREFKIKLFPTPLKINDKLCYYVVIMSK